MSACFRQCLGALALTAVVAAGAAWAEEADDRYAVAAAHYDQGRWQMAVEEFQAFLRAAPEHAKAAEASFFLAEALVQLKRFDEAAPYYRRYLDHQPPGRFSREALFRVGEADYLAGHRQEAAKTLDEFVRRYPRDPLGAYALPYLGELALASGDAAGAAAYYRSGLEQFPQGRLQDDCRFGLARALEKQGQTEEAERLYLALSAKSTSNMAGDALYQLGALQFAATRFDEAAATLASFESRYPHSARVGEARLAHAWALFKLKRPDEAKAMLDRLKDDPGLAPDAQYWLGMIQRGEEQWAEAAATLSAVAQANPNHRLAAAMRFYAGDASLQAGAPAAATRLFDHVLAKPDDPLADDAARGKVQAALQLKDHAAVDRLAEQFPRQFPNSPLRADVARMLARSLLDRREPGRAIEILEPLTRGPAKEGKLEDRYLLAVAYQAAKRVQDAMAALLPVVDSAEGPLKASAELVQGSLLLAMGRAADAVAPLEAALSGKLAGDEVVRAKAELSIALARTGKIDRAKSVYAELGTEPPRSELLVAALQQLAESAYEAGDLAWAGELFDRLAQSGTEAQQCKGLSGVAWCQYKAGRMKEAAEGFAKLLARKPEPTMAAEAALARGRALEQLGQGADALAAYDVVIREYPKTESYAAALNAAAALNSRNRQFDKAAGLLARLAGMTPPPTDLDAVLYDWAWALADAGRLAESNQILERIRKDHPRSRFWADSVFRLASRARDAQDGRRAGTLAAELLARNPQPRLREHGLYLAGQVAASEGRWADLQKFMQQLVADYPQSELRSVADYWVAEALYRQQDYAGAGARLEALAERIGTAREPWMAMIALRRAQVLAHDKRWNEAEQLASTIAADYPGFEQQHEVDYLLGRCRADQADFDGARKAYERVIRSPTGAKTETAAMAQWMIGESYFHQKNYEAALRAYLRVEILYAYPGWQSLALLQAAKCHELLGEWKEATELYRRLLTAYPTTPSAEEAGARLKIAQQRLPITSAELPTARQ